LIGYASEEGEDWVPSEETEKLIKEVRRKFEAIRPRHEILKAQMDGFDFDMDALVRSRCDLVASGYGTDRIHLGQRRQARDLSVMILMDVSLSTDGWIENRRVLDASGDALSILTFTSRRRNWVRMETVKDFDEPFGARPMRRLSALKPQFYTRIGPAVRHATHLLKERPTKHRLLLILTDGKPNDIDHYEGRYGIEDTKRAILESRRAGLSVFGVTVDREAQDYFPAIFGSGGYAIIDHVDRLPKVLPGLYRHLVTT
jgi:nitric oxide reductase NorD protein